MPNPDNFQFLYRRQLSQPMAQLLADPFSELTRKHQTALLVAATVTLLLSAGLVEVKEVGVESAKFALVTPVIAKWLALAVTFYMFIVYLLGVRADWAVAKAKHISPLAKIADVQAAMVADHEAQMRASEERRQRFERARNEYSKIEEQIQQRLATLSARSAEIEAMISSRESASASAKELAQEATELYRSEMAMRQELGDHWAPVKKEMSEMVQSISLEQTFSSQTEKRDIERTIRTFSILTQLRLVVEVLFPAAYALLALVWTILHP